MILKLGRCAAWNRALVPRGGVKYARHVALLHRPRPLSTTPEAAGREGPSLKSSICRVLDARGLDWQAGRQGASETIVVRECPFCDGIDGKHDNMWKLHFYLPAGTCFCFRCRASGPWHEIAPKVGKAHQGPPPQRATEHRAGRPAPRPQAPPPLLNEAAREAFQRQAEFYEATMQSNGDVAQRVQKERGLTAETLALYRVGLCLRYFGGVQAPCLTFPIVVSPREFNAEDREAPVEAQVVRLKMRGLANKALQRTEPVGGTHTGLFGWHTVPPDADIVVLTEGEFDAMAAFQATGLPAVSLPNGCNAIKEGILRPLNRFSTVIVWLDNDTHGRAASAKVCAILGDRARRVEAPEGAKDANDALLQGLDLKRIVEKQ